MKTCSQCQGSGRAHCPWCDEGYEVIESWSYMDEPVQIIQTCSHCSGSGQQICPECDGAGELLDPHCPE